MCSPGFFLSYCAFLSLFFPPSIIHTRLQLYIVNARPGTVSETGHNQLIPSTHTHTLHTQSARRTEETSHKNTSSVCSCSIYNIWIWLRPPSLSGLITRGPAGRSPCPLCKYSPQMSACGSAACNFSVRPLGPPAPNRSAVCHRRRGNGCAPFPGERLSCAAPVGPAPSRSCVRGPSAAQAAAGRPGELWLTGTRRECRKWSNTKLIGHTHTVDL